MAAGVSSTYGDDPGPSSGRCDMLGARSTLVIPALRRAQLSTFERPSTPVLDGAAVLLLNDDLAVVGTRTAASTTCRRCCRPKGDGTWCLRRRSTSPPNSSPSKPVSMIGRLGARLRPWALMDDHQRRTNHCEDSRRTDDCHQPRADPPTERASLYGRVAGLTGRETDVLDTVVAGHDSRHAARILTISEHTLQDHLKSIFAKTHTDSRRVSSPAQPAPRDDRPARGPRRPAGHRAHYPALQVTRLRGYRAPPRPNGDLSSVRCAQVSGKNRREHCGLSVPSVVSEAWGRGRRD